MSALARQRLQRVTAFCLGVWACGVQVHELFATIGAWSTTICAVVLLVLERRSTELKAWWPVGAFLLCALGLPLGGGHAPTGTGLARLLDIVFLPAAAVVVVRVERRLLERVAVAAGVVLLISCAAAAVQYFGLWPRSETFSSLWWAQVPTDRVYEPVPGRADRFMGGGLLLHRLRFANVTSLLAVLAFARALRRRERRGPFIALAAIAALSVAAFPHARAALAALVVGLVVVVVTALERRRLALAGAAAVVVGAVMMIVSIDSVRTRFAGALEAADRSLLASAGVAAVQSAPVTGLGAGRFRPGDWLPTDAPVEVRAHLGKAHNQFLTIAAELGTPSMLWFVAVLALCAAQAVKAGRDGAGALGALVIIVGLSLLHDPLFHAEASMALFGGLGAALGFSRPGATDG